MSRTSLFDSPAKPPADMEFFLRMVPPKATHHAKRIVKRGNFHSMADKPELVRARGSLQDELRPYQPPAPIEEAVRLTLEFTWDWLKGTSQRERAKGRIYKTTKPDCTNAAKTLEDCLVQLLFIKDDAQVAELVVRKFLGDNVGIRVVIERLGV